MHVSPMSRQIGACAAAFGVALGSVGCSERADRNEAATEAERVGVSGETLIGAPEFPPRSLAFFLVDTGSGLNLTDVEARRLIFGTAVGDKSLKQYFLETSYGTQNISGDVFGPISFPPPSGQGCRPFDESNRRELASSMRGMVSGTYDHFLFFMSSCVGSAFHSDLGQPSQPRQYSWYHGVAPLASLVRGISRNLGFESSSSLGCGDRSFADDPNTCTHGETGDRYDPLGSGGYHPNAWQKVYRGWLQKCNGIEVRASGTYNLFPLEAPCNGPQVLQIPMTRERAFVHPDGDGDGGTSTVALRYYYLELRTAFGFDANLPNAPFVLVRVADDFRSLSEAPGRTWLLDMNPSRFGFGFDGLGAGERFTDPAGGVSFTVESINDMGAKIAVTIPASSGTSTCLDGSTMLPPETASCGTNGSGGFGGTSGAAGTGGTGASGGSVGSAGAGATGGSGGTGLDDAGNIGGSGAGGSVTGGVGGGTTGAGGSAAGGGAVGGASGGSASSATGGAGGLADPNKIAPAESDGGCGCRTARGSRSERAGTWFAVGCLLFIRLIRRRLPR